MSDPVKRFLEKRALHHQEYLFREKLHSPFKGKIFQLVRPKDWFTRNEVFLLKIFDPEDGLKETFSIFDERQNYYGRAVPAGELLLATGKVVVRKILLKKKEYDLTYGLEVLTSKGVGYMPREFLRGPLVREEKSGELVLDYTHKGGS